MTRYAFTAIALWCSLKMLNACVKRLHCARVCCVPQVANVHVINLLISPKSQTISARPKRAVVPLHFLRYSTNAEAPCGYPALTRPGSHASKSAYRFQRACYIRSDTWSPYIIYTHVLIARAEKIVLFCFLFSVVVIAAPKPNILYIHDPNFSTLRWFWLYFHPAIVVIARNRWNGPIILLSPSTNAARTDGDRYTTHLRTVKR